MNVKFCPQHDSVQTLNRYYYYYYYYYCGTSAAGSASLTSYGSVSLLLDPVSADSSNAVTQRGVTRFVHLSSMSACERSHSSRFVLLVYRTMKTRRARYRAQWQRWLTAEWAVPRYVASQRERVRRRERRAKFRAFLASYWSDMAPASTLASAAAAAAAAVSSRRSIFSQQLPTILAARRRARGLEQHTFDPLLSRTCALSTAQFNDTAIK